MPTYEYRCKECGEQLEVVQAFTDDPLTECPACSGPLRKVFGNIGVTFKGSGFYRTDSRGGGSSKTPAGDNGKGGDSGGSGDKVDTPSTTKSDGASTTKTDSGAGATKKSSSTDAA